MAFESETRWTFEELEDAYSPRTAAAKTGNAGAEKGEIARVIRELDMAAIKSSTHSTELEYETRSKFEAALLDSESLRALWNVGVSPHDGSRFAMKLARRLKPTGKFTSTEFGQLLYCTEHSSDPEKMDARYIARCWAKAPANAEDEFDDDAGDEGSEPAGLPFRTDATSALRPLQRRPWIDYGYTLRGEVSAIIAPPGTGKSTYAINHGLALTSGREGILHHTATTRTSVAIYNFEDSSDELHLRTQAAMRYHGITEESTWIDGKPGLATSPLRGAAGCPKPAPAAATRAMSPPLGRF